MACLIAGMFVPDAIMQSGLMTMYDRTHNLLCILRYISTAFTLSSSSGLKVVNSGKPMRADCTALGMFPAVV